MTDQPLEKRVHLDADYPFETRRRTIEQRKVGASVMSSIRLREDRGAMEAMSDQLRHTLTAYVLADKIIGGQAYSATTSIEYPETTWQTFKSRHAGSWWLGWLVRRRPVLLHREIRIVKVEVDRWLHYPEAEIQIEGLGRPIIVEEARQVGGW